MRLHELLTTDRHLEDDDDDDTHLRPPQPVDVEQSAEQLGEIRRQHRL